MANKLILYMNYETLEFERVMRITSNTQIRDKLKNCIEMVNGSAYTMLKKNNEYYDFSLEEKILCSDNDGTDSFLITTTFLIKEAYEKNIMIELMGLGCVMLSVDEMFVTDVQGNHKLVKFDKENKKLARLRNCLYRQQCLYHDIKSIVNRDVKGLDNSIFTRIEFFGNDKIGHYDFGNKLIGKFLVHVSSSYDGFVRIEVKEDSISRGPVENNSIKIMDKQYFVAKGTTLFVPSKTIKLMV